MKNCLTVFVVDDDPAVRDSLAMLLEQEDYAVQTFDSGEAFLAACGSACPACCAVVDVRMPGMDGLQLQQEMTRRNILLPVIFLTGEGDIPTSVRAMKAGAVDFLTKPVAAADLLASARTALAASLRLHAQAEIRREAVERLALLTDRERDVMALAIAGCANKEIAAHLGISHHTVEIHKARLLKKTNTDNLIELARLVEASRTFD